MTVSLARGIVQCILSKAPIKLLKALCGNVSVFPFYHLITKSTPWYFEDAYPFKTPKAFEKELDLLLRYWMPISLNQLLEKVKTTGKLPERCFHLTFDDGYREVFQYAYPILKRKGIPATIFLCSSLLDNASMLWEHKKEIVCKKLENVPDLLRTKVGDFLKVPSTEIGAKINGTGYRERQIFEHLANILEIDFQAILASEKPYLTAGQVTEMMRQEFTFGAHAVDHPYFQEISFDEGVNQVAESTNAIAQKFALDYKVFAFPYGEFELPRKFFDVLFNEKQIDLCFGTRGIIPDEYSRIIQRCEMETGTKPAVALREELAQKYIRQLAKNDSVKRKTNAA